MGSVFLYPYEIYYKYTTIMLYSIIMGSMFYTRISILLQLGSTVLYDEGVVFYTLGLRRQEDGAARGQDEPRRVHIGVLLDCYVMLYHVYVCICRYMCYCIVVTIIIIIVSSSSSIITIVYDCHHYLIYFRSLAAVSAASGPAEKSSFPQGPTYVACSILHC